MEYGREPAPKPIWKSAHAAGDNLIVHLDRTEPAVHIAVIPREVLEDVTRSSEGELNALELAGRERVGEAIEKAWARDDLKEAHEAMGSGLRNIQLWVTLDDFS
jgi:hypothetical protein